MQEKLQDIAKWIGAEGLNIEKVYVTGASIDSRTIKKGELFIPFRGEKVNGHRFVEQAFENGASASLWLKDEPNPPTHLPLLFVDSAEYALQEMARAYLNLLTCTVIGVTGSNGKTSTKDLIASVLSPYFKVVKTEGNFNNELGLPLTLLSLNKDTEYAVLEMGMSSFGEISFLSTLARPKYAVITNIGEAHMLDLGSREGIAKAKFEIIDGLLPDGKLFYDGDEPLLQDLVKPTSDLETVAFGYGTQNDLSIEQITSTEQGSQFTVTGILKDKFILPIYGEHQMKNALAAILIGQEVGLSIDQIQKALGEATLTDMRMQPVVCSSGMLFINDAYNAAPTSVKAALSFIQQTEIRNQKWVVLGDMLELGDNEKAYHESLADQINGMRLEGVCLFGPRMKWLVDQLQQSNPSKHLIWSESDYIPIIEAIQKFADEESVILLKGSRGMALENILKAFTTEHEDEK